MLIKHQIYQIDYECKECPFRSYHGKGEFLYCDEDGDNYFKIEDGGIACFDECDITKSLDKSK